MTQEQKLERSFFAIEGVRSNPEMVKTLKQVGWTPQETTQGWKMYEHAYGSFEEQKEKLSQQRNATDALNASEDALNKIYKKHLHLTRMAVPYQRNVYLTLELNGRRKAERSAWIGQIRSFYKNIDLVVSELAEYGVTAEEIDQAQAMIETVAAARIKQHEARSAAQQARIDRDQSYQKLDAWMSRFIRTARFAFAENPQQLEALGIVVK
ncbi:MAG: hypothetical protein RIG62_25120 [Cyclobacteriaceae bacterium]